MSRPRTTLAVRIAMLSCAIAVITALIAGSISVRLIRQANDRAARQTLGKLADAAQETARLGINPDAAQTRARNTLRALKIAAATIGGDGAVQSNSPLARDALTPSEVGEVLAGSDISSLRTVDGRRALVEARSTPAGGIVLAQRRTDAVAIGEAAIRRLLWALLIATTVAVALGLLVAYRLASPLRRTAAAAHALASGRRDVAVPPQGPAEVAEVAEALNTLTGALAWSEARQRDFLLSVSHDLRTPLTAIAGYAESLADGVVTGPDTRQVGQIVLAEAHRLERLVADLLDLARLGAQDFRIDIATVDVGGVVDAAAQVWQQRCAASDVSFVLERQPGHLPAWTDPSRLRQVLDGLLENALRVTPAGAPIILAARTEPGAVVAEIRDGGPGLSDDDLAVAFDRSALYERYRGIRQVGTGLGLAIVHGLVTRTGGSIEAGHAAEGGARFTVRMPAAG